MRANLHKRLNPLLALWWRMSRGLTLGVRAIVIDDGRVLLVRHGYTPGWHFPGGGVEPGETAQAALARELEEEAGLALRSPPELVSVHHHPGLAGRDHVLVFRVTQWQAVRTVVPSAEIAEVRWWPLDALPPDTTRATRARLAEIASADGVATPDW